MTAETPQTSTTAAVAAQAQSRGDAAAVAGAGDTRARDPFACLGKTFILGAGIGAVATPPYERSKQDPVYRQLRIYTIDPATPRLDAAVAKIDVPYEPLDPGPSGRLFRVVDQDATHGLRYRQADLDSREALLRSGYVPSETDPRFHQQMVYAVCSNVYATFRKALGRHLSWKPGIDRLLVLPHAFRDRNAYYDNGALYFGYFNAEEDGTGRTLPGGLVFTCLSHDIIAHEVTHAILDGLRARFSIPSGADVVAFHEAFADLVAVFQRFSYREVVRHAIQRSRNDIASARFLTELALQFGHATGRHGALRSAIDTVADDGVPQRFYDSGIEPHALGAILVGAIFEAFLTIYRRKTARYIRVATNGSGVLPPGELPYDLQTILAERASKLAGQFLAICIRAIDYCPPVGLTFGDYLRALITADFDIVPDDDWDYRGALIEAFRRRKIYPRDVTTLSQEALLWRPPRIALPAIGRLAFAQLRFRGDPGVAVEQKELHEQACHLGEFISRAGHLREFGLVGQDDPLLAGDRVSLPCVESIRISRRVGPDGQIVFDLVAEVTQARTVAAADGRAAFTYHGGSTIILDPLGEVRYVILKNVANEERLRRRIAFLESDTGKRLWEVREGMARPRKSLFKLLHDDGSHD